MTDQSLHDAIWLSNPPLSSCRACGVQEGKWPGGHRDKCPVDDIIAAASADAEAQLDRAQRLYHEVMGHWDNAEVRMEVLEDELEARKSVVVMLRLGWSQRGARLRFKGSRGGAAAGKILQKCSSELGTALAPEEPRHD